MTDPRRKRGRLYFKVRSAEAPWRVSDPEGLKRISEGLARKYARRSPSTQPRSDRKEDDGD